MVARLVERMERHEAWARMGAAPMARPAKRAATATVAPSLFQRLTETMAMTFFPAMF